MATTGLEDELRAQEALGQRLHEFAGEWVSIRGHEVAYHAPTLNDLISQIEGDPDPGSIMRVSDNPGAVCFY